MYVCSRQQFESHGCLSLKKERLLAVQSLALLVHFALFTIIIAKGLLVFSFLFPILDPGHSLYRSGHQEF